MEIVLDRGEEKGDVGRLSKANAFIQMKGIISYSFPLKRIYVPNVSMIWADTNIP